MATMIEVRNLSKQYQLGRSPHKFDTFMEFFVRSMRKSWNTLRGTSLRGYRPSPSGSIWALKGINFDVQEGDIVGIIGPNGSGKTTLLKIISRITDPTEGYVKLRGRLASLLEVGTGFHPDLTGRENIFLNGAILGMSKAEIQSKFDEIVAFSEISKFLDTPVKRYSSGMYVRLAFAVAAHLEPEILIVDEVLAVGDMAFQKKCLGKMSEVSKAGRTVLFVSHNMAAVENLCRTGIVLRQGKLASCGSAKQAIEYYVHSVFGEGVGTGSPIIDLSKAVNREPKYRPLLKRLELLTSEGRPLNGGLPFGAPLKANMYFYLEKPMSNLDALLSFRTLLGQVVFVANSGFEPNRPTDDLVGEQMFVCEIPSLALIPGEYMIDVALAVGDSLVDCVGDATRLTVVPCDYYGTGRVPKYGTCVLEHRWHLNQGTSPAPATVDASGQGEKET